MRLPGSQRTTRRSGRTLGRRHHSVQTIGHAHSAGSLNNGHPRVYCGIRLVLNRGNRVRQIGVIPTATPHETQALAIFGSRRPCMAPAAVVAKRAEDFTRPRSGHPVVDVNTRLRAADGPFAGSGQLPFWRVGHSRRPRAQSPGQSRAAGGTGRRCAARRCHKNCR